MLFESEICQGLLLRWLERTPDKREVESSSLSRPTNIGGVAQLGEHLLCTQRVVGSIPFASTMTYFYSDEA